MMLAAGNPSSGSGSGPAGSNGGESGGGGLFTHSIFNPMSPQADAISNLTIFTMIVAGVICLAITAVIIFSVIRYRARPGDTEEAPQIFGNTRLEVTWTVIPFIIVVILFGTSVTTMIDSSPGQTGLQGAAARNPNRMNVIGHQWWWEVKYPSGVVTANVIHIPVGQRWVIALDSDDVIHSLWFPQCGPKVDAVPGQTNYIWLECDKVGTYHGNCSEYCGAGHAWMLNEVVAEPLAKFKAWEQQQLSAPPSTPAPGFTASEVASGAKLYTQYACSSCHDTGIGPLLTHVGSRDIIAGGALSNTPAHMQQWLLDPDAIKPGVHMPNFQFTNAQAHDLTAYLESLR